MIKESKFIISAPYLVSVSSPYIKDGALLVSDGAIKEVGNLTDTIKKYPDIPHSHLDRTILLPGLINAHIHLEYSALGHMTEPVDFLLWIEDLISRQKSLTVDEKVSAIGSSINDLISSGVTSVGEVSKSGLSLESLVRSGLKGRFFSEIVAVDNSKKKSAISQFKTTFEKYKCALSASGLKPGIFPHSIYTLSQSALEEISADGELIDFPLGMHLLELKDENGFVRGDVNALTGFVKKFGLDTTIKGSKWSDPLAYIGAMGLLRRSTHLVHLVHADERGFAMIKEHDVKIVLCPRSNFLLNNGAFPFLDSLKYDIKTGLGTDSLASNFSLDIFEEMRFIKESVKSGIGSVRESQDINEKLIHMATLGGAEALGIEDETGSLSSGKCADIAAVRIDDAAYEAADEAAYEAAYEAENFSPVDYLVERADASHVMMTMIDGRVKYDVTRQKC